MYAVSLAKSFILLPSRSAWYILHQKRFAKVRVEKCERHKYECVISCIFLSSQENLGLQIAPKQNKVYADVNTW